MSYPYPPQDQRRPSLEISRFSTLFQQWDIGAQSDDSRSPTSRRGSHLLDVEVAPQPSIDAETAGGTGARQRTTQACDKCRERKTKCSGDHPVCKRCTTRGLVCHYSERDRVRGPAKARLRTAASSPVLDTRFATEGMAGYPPPYKPYPTSMYSHPYPHAQPPSPMHEYHEHSPALPPQQQQHIYQQQSRYNPISPYTIPLRGRPTLSRTSLPQIMHTHHTAEFNNPFAAAPNAPSTAHNPHPYHLLPQQQPQQLVRRVQSHSAVYRQRPPVLTIPMSMNGSESENAASPSLAYAMQPGTVQPGGSPRSESPSATASTFNFNVATASHSCESSHAEPIPASELDLRLMAARQQQPQRGPRPTLPMLHTDHRPKPRYLSLSDAGPPLYRPQPSESLQLLPPRAPSSAEIQVPSINEVFGNPWGAPAPAAGSASDETSGSTANGRADVELVYPSPVTPITLARHANEHGELEPGRKRVDDDGAEAVGAAAGGDGVGAL